MSTIEIAMLGASSLKDGSVRWQCAFPVGNDNEDVEPLGEVPVYQALGHAALPYPKDANGHAEAVIVRGAGSRKAIAIGGRDTRSAKIVGKMDPGDTVDHSTDPDQSAMVRLQGKKKSASLIAKGKSGKHMMVLLDGTNEKLQITAKGAMFEIDSNGDVSITSKGGASILLQGKTISLNGEIKIPGMPPGSFLWAFPMPGPLGTAPGAPLVAFPVMGVGGYT